MVVDYFAEINELKDLMKLIKDDVSRLTGPETKLLVSARRGASIGSQVVKNRQLCETPEEQTSAKCGSSRCKTCPSLCNRGDTLTVNNKVATATKPLNCKSRNVIYLAQCTKCDENAECSYIGQTAQEFHLRVNGHRSCFALNDQGLPDPAKADKSALALHNYKEHYDEFNMNNFQFLLIDQVRPRNLNRSEAVHINEFRTNVKGLNRKNVQK